MFAFYYRHCWGPCLPWFNALLACGNWGMTSYHGLGFLCIFTTGSPAVDNRFCLFSQDGRVLFLHMFCKGLKYGQLQAHKGKILEVEHDQKSTALVTLCRSSNSIDAQFWSLPNLHLQRQITCQDDVTCHVRMVSDYVDSCDYDIYYSVCVLYLLYGTVAFVAWKNSGSGYTHLPAWCHLESKWKSCPRFINLNVVLKKFFFTFRIYSKKRFLWS